MVVQKQPWDESTKKMMARVNATPVTRDELIEVVQEIGDLNPDERDMTGHIITVTRLHPDDADKVQAIMFRLEALARFLISEGAPGWTLSLPNGAVLTQEPVFAVAAMQPLIEENGDVAFERETFLEKVLEIAELDQVG